METAKRRRLERAGWKVGTTQEFLRLSDAEAAYVEMKVRLAKAFATKRTKRRVTQAQVAKLLKSSQSRVAKIEAGDPSVSADLMIRSLLALGCTPRDVAVALGK